MYVCMHECVCVCACVCALHVRVMGGAYTHACFLAYENTKSLPFKISSFFLKTDLALDGLEDVSLELGHKLGLLLGAHGRLHLVHLVQLLHGSLARRCGGFRGCMCEREYTQW